MDKLNLKDYDITIDDIAETMYGCRKCREQFLFGYRECLELMIKAGAFSD